MFKKKLPNDREVILNALKPYQNDITRFIVESTSNWHWLVDAFLAEDYKVHLVNPAEIKNNTGLKYADDQHDAFWRAEDRVTPYLAGSEDLALAGMVSKESIDFLTWQIKKIETVIAVIENKMEL